MSRRERIVARVRAIPEGFVRTYGDIDPRAPRLVGLILSQSADDDLPWPGVRQLYAVDPQRAGASGDDDDSCGRGHARLAFLSVVIHIDHAPPTLAGPASPRRGRRAAERPPG